jgi:carboxy-terminal domain RNA polymerase II polypeptide A small phosphatase
MSTFLPGIGESELTLCSQSASLVFSQGIGYYVVKRPGVDKFLVEMAKHYEIVVFTAANQAYADPLLDLLDTNRVIRTRLYSQHCMYDPKTDVSLKDLSRLNRDLSQTIIVDDRPTSYSLHPDNAINCTWYNEKNTADRELEQIGAFLTGIKDCNDVRGLCKYWRDWPNVTIAGK